ncbi:MAG: aryl-alcohol dehydrogenase-like predicted oxidoreductase [Saprospiraceae bacterium]
MSKNQTIFILTKKLPLIGLGTAAIGRPQYINIRQDTTDTQFSLERFRQKGLEMLDAAYAQGIRYFDTAPGYGMAEQLLLDWIAHKDDNSIEIATKWGYTYVANFDPNATQHEIKEHSLAKLDEQWEQSKNFLPRLFTYQIHSATFETGVLNKERILNRLAELKSERGILLGITTTGANQVEVLKKAAEVEVEGQSLFDTFQVTYNIFDQSLAPISKELSAQNKKLVIKEALANGRVFPNTQYTHYTAAYDVLDRLAKKYDVGIDAIALRFCADSIPVFKVLSGAANHQHLFDNLKVNHFELEEEDVAILKKLAIKPTQYWTERKLLGWN